MQHAAAVLDLYVHRHAEGRTVRPDGTVPAEGYAVGYGANAPENRVPSVVQDYAVLQWLRTRVAAYPDASAFGLWRTRDALVFDPIVVVPRAAGEEVAAQLAAALGEEAAYSLHDGREIPASGQPGAS
jgi:hypothetical protein